MDPIVTRRSDGDGHRIESSVAVVRGHALRVCARLVWVVLALTLADTAFAIDWEKMVMPGPLAEKHAEHEKECSSCHQAFNAEAQRALCLDCHKEVTADLADDVGFHSRHPLASSGQCRSCHAEHKGRDADIRGLTEATFDHALTDYPLLGAHQSAACETCHLPKVPRREAPLDCIGCHRKDDAHGGALAETCGDCHDEVAWKTTRFNHDLTNYPLKGAHETASCLGCHVGNRYKQTPTDCVSCHSIDDAHSGRFGKKCGDCHTSTSWRQEGFDHGNKSGFPLVGSHAKATCVTCHRQAPGERKLPKDCSGCHASEDVHAGRFGSACGDCHKPEKWAGIRFDHAKQTKFALRGAHEKIGCESCHSADVKKTKMDSRCVACHKRDDVHRESLGSNCENCHNAESFSSRVLFDHGLTAFPLLGLHAMAPCESCHTSHSFKKDELGCYSCHRADDKHKRTLGATCESCHNPNGWDVWRFDHDQRTNFALEGAHENLDCAVCHRQPKDTGFQMAQTCVDCHSGDDAHRGGFGRDCSDCHGPKAWKPASFGRSRSERR